MEVLIDCKKKAEPFANKEHCYNDTLIFSIVYIIVFLFLRLLVLSVRCTPKVKKFETKSSLNYDGRQANGRDSKMRQKSLQKWEVTVGKLYEPVLLFLPSTTINSRC